MKTYYWKNYYVFKIIVNINDNVYGTLLVEKRLYVKISVNINDNVCGTILVEKRLYV